MMPGLFPERNRPSFTFWPTERKMIMQRELIIHDSSHNPIYNIVICPDFTQLAEQIRGLGFSGRKFVIIADTNTARYGEEILEKLQEIGKCFLEVIPAGETHKTLDTVREIYKRLIEEKLDRGDCLIALGGGVVGDITGFAAATYLRGIAFLQVPTTLLAQSDSSVGGKTGVDFDGYKNMVGAFCMPKLVYMNVSTLKTLEKRCFLSGMGEVIKHGLIRDRAFFDWILEHAREIKALDPETLILMDERNCRIKGEVVEEDPTEKGIRSLLNFGHTLGHAIEKFRAESMYHGECVSVGMVAAARISLKRGYISEEDFTQIKTALTRFELPVSVAGLNITDVIAATKNDKKVVGNRLRFVLLKRLGEAFLETDVTEEEMRDALEYVSC